jgi:hypothetical protein
MTWVEGRNSRELPPEPEPEPVAFAVVLGELAEEPLSQPRGFPHPMSPRPSLRADHTNGRGQRPLPWGSQAPWGRRGRVAGTRVRPRSLVGLGGHWATRKVPYSKRIAFLACARHRQVPWFSAAIGSVPAAAAVTGDRDRLPWPNRDRRCLLTLHLPLPLSMKSQLSWAVAGGRDGGWQRQHYSLGSSTGAVLATGCRSSRASSMESLAR